MPRFAANLTTLFNEQPFLDRFAAARAAGFRGVEYLFPYAHRVRDLADLLQEHGLVQVLHNLPAGNWEKGERGIACHPDRVHEFREGVELAIEYAKALGCRQVNCLVGITPPMADPKRIEDTLVENLRYAARSLEAEGIYLLIEPLNTRDIPMFYLSRTRQAMDIIEAVGSPNLFLQYDVYHMQVMEGDIVRTIETHLPRIGHIQIADNPGRHEPGTGELNFQNLFAHIDRVGYMGWIGCEYRPRFETEAGLDWYRPYR
ncbi:MAG TPA: hydroxypyruvate isomerase, partial [Burkholderiales bacterium]